ncbi:RagB/SusD family nutrient uptake outer membrane protein [Geofilum sp. OHC36d9]|uniref:RagB/SusD family nutrient uptake outer membrane protein n=1 Tax=Geofilum sp. OHC36d9 TaxID=3458413 RepID=UPI004033ACED
MKTNYIKIVCASITILTLAGGCSDVIDPQYVGYEEDVDVWSNSKYAHGVLDKVYDWVNDNASDFYGIEDDYLSDNSVQNNDVTRFATGGASASYYPIGKWEFHYRNIVNINQYLAYGLDIPIKMEDTIPSNRVEEKLYRFGEAHFLRAWSESELLKQYAGPVDAAKTKMLGIPLLRDVYSTDEITEIPRSSYQACVDSILADLDIAIAYCPFYYDGSSVLTSVQYKGRATQRAALALKSRVLLFAASPAYNATNDVEKWTSAASAAYDAIMMDGGLLDLGSLSDENNEEHVDVIWKTLLSKNNDMENSHFPPSYYGSGRCNPSQSLVDAFPMADGTPIVDDASTYNFTNPYENRDARFEKFIVHNGDPLYGYKTIQTYVGGADAKGGLRNDATRTGYYMQRFTVDCATDSDPRVKDGKSSSGFKFVRLLDREEVYLNFIEAANEAGTDPLLVLPNMNFSAYDVFRKVRARGGDNALDYTDSLAANGLLTKELFREIIKNERRIEFCFRGFRYWDLRRWLEPLDVINAAVTGMEIIRDTSLGVELYEYNVIDVESRRYLQNTYYGPLPYDEVSRSEALVQNYGW